MFNNILVPFDGSASARKALEVAISMAKAFNSKLSIVSVEENIPMVAADVGEVKEEKEYQNGFFAKLQRDARELVKSHEMELQRADVLTGHVSKSIINHSASLKSDLIIMGHSGRSGACANFLGTTAEKVSRYAKCTVMIVR
jgi:nucleotide-binding universal stress UspA family protein